MGVVQFLEYLHERSATSGLSEALAEILMLRGHAELVPAELVVDARRRVAS